MQRIESIIREYIADVVHMSIATSENNRPWISEVHFAYDEELNLYFISRPSRRHSQEIAKNNQIAGNIIKQHTKGEPVRGVYYEGVVEMMDAITEEHPAFASYHNRFGADPAILDEQQDNDGHRWYKITVSTFYLFDELEMQPAGKHELPWNSV